MDFRYLYVNNRQKLSV